MDQEKTVKTEMGASIKLFRDVLAEVFGDDYKERIEADFDWGMAASMVVSNAIDHMKQSLGSQTDEPPTIEQIKAFAADRGGWKTAVLEHIDMWKINNEKILNGEKGEIYPAQVKMYRDQREGYERIESELRGTPIDTK